MNGKQIAENLNNVSFLADDVSQCPTSAGLPPPDRKQLNSRVSEGPSPLLRDFLNVKPRLGKSSLIYNPYDHDPSFDDSINITFRNHANYNDQNSK